MLLIFIFPEKKNPAADIEDSYRAGINKQNSKNNQQKPKNITQFKSFPVNNSPDNGYNRNHVGNRWRKNRAAYFDQFVECN